RLDARERPLDVPARRRDLGEQLVRRRDVLARRVPRRQLEQERRVPARAVELTAPEPVLARARLQPHVVAPSEPRVALEDLLDLLERLDTLLALAGRGQVRAEVDERVRF